MIQRITDDLLDKLLATARNSPRGRIIHTLHSGPWEHAHRMLNAITPTSYARPHRHNDPHKAEGFIILRGKAVAVVFDEAGNVDSRECTLLDPKSSTMGVDIAPGVWHSLVALEDCVLYEVKGQPDVGYNAETDKEFAVWSPTEDSEAAVEYLRELAGLVRQHFS